MWGLESLKIRISRGGVLHCLVTRRGTAVCSWSASEKKMVIVLQMLQVATDNVSRAGYVLGIIPQREPCTRSAGGVQQFVQSIFVWSSWKWANPLTFSHYNRAIQLFTFDTTFTWSCKKLQKKFYVTLYFWKQFSLILRKDFQNFGVTIQQNSCIIYRRIVYVSITASVSGSLNKKNTEPEYNLVSGNLNNCRLVGPCQVS